MSAPDWTKIFEEYADVYFLRLEVKRLEEENLALEWVNGVSYSLGYEDAKAGKSQDPDFRIDVG